MMSWLERSSAMVGVGDERVADGGGGLRGGVGAGDAGEVARDGDAAGHAAADGVAGTWGGGGTAVGGGLFLLAAGLDELFEGLLDVLGLGVLDGVDLHLLQDRHGLVDELEDLDHAVDVLLRVGDEEGVGAFEVLDVAVGAFEALDGLLGLLGGDVLGGEDLADELAELGVAAALGQLQEGLDALLPDGLEGDDEGEALADGDDADAVELELLLDGLEILGVGPVVLVGGTEGHRYLRDVGGGEEGAVGDLGVDLEEELGGGVVELQLGAAALPALGLGELLGHLGGAGGGLLCGGLALLGGGGAAGAAGDGGGADLGVCGGGHEQGGQEKGMGAHGCGILPHSAGWRI